MVVGADGKLPFVPDFKFGEEMYLYSGDNVFGRCALHNRLGQYLGVSQLKYGDLRYLFQKMLPCSEALFLVPISEGHDQCDLEVEDMVDRSVFCATWRKGLFFKETSFADAKKHLGGTCFRIGVIEHVKDKRDFLEVVNLLNSTCVSSRFFGSCRNYGMNPLYDRVREYSEKNPKPPFDIHNCQFYGPDGKHLGTRDLDDSLMRNIAKTVPTGQFVFATFEGAFSSHEREAKDKNMAVEGTFEEPNRGFFEGDTLAVFYNGKVYCTQVDSRWHRFHKAGDVCCEMNQPAFSDMVATLCASAGIK